VTGVSPYASLDPRAYWRSGVADRAALDPGDLYQPRFPIDRQMNIVTAGSCFAQHVGRALRASGFRVVDTELPPDLLSVADAAAHGFGLFSARYGNIYTTRQLNQLLAEAYGEFAPADAIWEKDGRFYDALRPGIEPEGLRGAEDVAADRALHLARVREAFEAADLFVFTLGLTETWMHRDSGTVYPTAPGTIAGSYDPAVHAFCNFDPQQVFDDFDAVRTRLKRLKPSMRFLVTVSPVPLTATASGLHVEVATAYSKAVLRAVCGMLPARHEDVDYFPSYEVITSQNARGVYYGPNRREVTAEGVAAAMRLFLTAHGIAEAAAGGGGEGRRRRRAVRETDNEAVCEEVLLEAFAR
jgi:hypothetical protein